MVGMDTAFRAEQEKNALYGIVVNDVGSAAETTALYANTLLPIDTTLVGMGAAVRAVQYAKALAPIRRREVGKKRVFSAESP